MIVKKTSAVSWKENTMDLDITQDQLDSWLGGQLIQDAMPNLTPDEREFLISGTTPEEWKDIFGEEDEDEFEEN